MKQFEMKNGRIARKLYNKVKFRFPRWRRFRWIWYGIWAVWIAVDILWIVELKNVYGGFTAVFFKDLITIWLVMGVFQLILMPVIYAFLIAPAAEIFIAAWHRVVLDGTKLQSEWIPPSMQVRNVGGDHVITIVPYENIRRIVWNERLQRLEIYGEYLQKVHPTEFYHKGEWLTKERTFFTLNKRERVLHLYNYFPNMEELIDCLQTKSGCTVER